VANNLGLTFVIKVTEKERQAIVVTVRPCHEQLNLGLARVHSCNTASGDDALPAVFPTIRVHPVKRSEVVEC
jgi:hypothetical protein